MGWRLYRRLKILPGVRVNLSRSGVSTSIGGRGAWLTFGRRGTRATIGAPGTGPSYSTTLSMHNQVHGEGAGAAQGSAVESSPTGRAWRGWLWILLLLAILAIVVSSVHL